MSVSMMYEQFGRTYLVIRSFGLGECPETGGPDPDAGSWCAEVELGDAIARPLLLHRC